MMAIFGSLSMAVIFGLTTKKKNTLDYKKNARKIGRCKFHWQHFSSTSNALKSVVVSNIVTQQHFVVASCSKWFKKVDASSTSCFNLQQRSIVAWQCLRWVVIRATTFSTCNATTLRCKLQQFVARITSPISSTSTTISSHY